MSNGAQPMFIGEMANRNMGRNSGVAAESSPLSFDEISGDAGVGVSSALSLLSGFPDPVSQAGLSPRVFQDPEEVSRFSFRNAASSLDQGSSFFQCDTLVGSGRVSQADVSVDQEFLPFRSNSFSGFLRNTTPVDLSNVPFLEENENYSLFCFAHYCKDVYEKGTNFMPFFHYVNKRTYEIRDPFIQKNYRAILLNENGLPYDYNESFTLVERQKRAIRAIKRDIGC